MTVLATIPNGASNKDIRDTINALIADVAALKAGGGAVTPSPTINNTSGTSTLLGSQVSGFTAPANALDTRLIALGA